jgi:hypothetical protein
VAFLMDLESCRWVGFGSVRGGGGLLRGDVFVSMRWARKTLETHIGNPHNHTTYSWFLQT